MEITVIKVQLSIKTYCNITNFTLISKVVLSCPFYEDKTPGLQVYYKTQTAYCFSSNCATCGKSMDVIDFIMHMEKTSKHEAIAKATQLITKASTTGGGLEGLYSPNRQNSPKSTVTLRTRYITASRRRNT